MAEFLRHALLRSVVVPDRAQRELQESTRYSTSLVQDRSTEIYRLPTTLEGATVTLDGVVTDILGTYFDERDRQPVMSSLPD